jgi:hypothetical protein
LIDTLIKGDNVRRGTHIDKSIPNCIYSEKVTEIGVECYTPMKFDWVFISITEASTIFKQKINLIKV